MFNVSITRSVFCVLHVSYDIAGCAICSFWNCFEIMLMTLSFSLVPQSKDERCEQTSIQIARKYHFYSYFMRLSFADILFIYSFFPLFYLLLSLSLSPVSFQTPLHLMFLMLTIFMRSPFPMCIMYNVWWILNILHIFELHSRDWKYLIFILRS